MDVSTSIVVWMGVGGFLLGIISGLLGGDEIGKWRGELFGHPWPERKILPKVRKGYNYIWKVSPPKHPLLTV